ncbi:hypothetical protein PUN28_019046 [Cardiocondyla obscurior]|uniref:Uncharacterized protein n=1 Tax=Cardiocondyla obscurior TaxID=286306 RepID=A0AAW2ED53_9HYME
MDDGGTGRRGRSEDERERRKRMESRTSEIELASSGLREKITPGIKNTTEQNIITRQIKHVYLTTCGVITSLDKTTRLKGNLTSSPLRSFRARSRCFVAIRGSRPFHDFINNYPRKPGPTVFTVITRSSSLLITCNPGPLPPIPPKRFVNETLR